MSILDKVLKAKPSHFHATDLAEVKSWMYGFMVKKAPLDLQNPHQPDDQTIAQYMTAAGTDGVKLIQTLLAERHEAPENAQWFVAVALDRLHGIRPAEVRARRAELRIEPKRHKALTGEQQQFPAPESTPQAEGRPPAEPIEPRMLDPEFRRQLLAGLSRVRKAGA